MSKQKSQAQAKDTRGTNATRSDSASRRNPRLDASPKQDAGVNRQHAGDVGKDGYRDTKGSGPQTGGQRGQGRNVDDDGSQRSERQRFESGSDNRNQAITPGRDAGIYQHDAADRVRFGDDEGRRFLSDRDDDDDDNLRRAGTNEDEGVRREADSESGEKERNKPYGHQDRDNRKASQKSDDRRGQRQR